ncbi:MAG TPA: HAD-IC family P-type ATPase [Candidatus Limnocylindrales bacterium]|nr:HAD-IC family P-type ATPase [Candidatus Limnocylindrales bacterium]
MTDVANPHALPPEAVAASLAVVPAQGLGAAEARRRLATDGANELEPEEPTSVLRLLLESAMEPFVILLAVAGVLAVALGEVRDGLLILAGLIPIVGADVLTEYRGERALAALRDASAPRATVRREGRLVDIAAADVVVGDVVCVRVGDVVPADIRLFQADGLSIDRSVLTGESVPEAPATVADPVDAPLVDRRSIAFAGTSVVAGRGEGITVAVGQATAFGAIATSLGARQARRSPLQRELDRLVRLLLIVAIGLIAVTAGLGFVRGNPLGANLLAGISAAIAAIPEEPPVLLAVVLGLGAYRLLRRGVLVRRLNAEEVLGAVDLIVTDKTGTLTENRLEVASVADRDGEVAGGARRLAILTEALRAEDDAWTGAHAAGVSSFTAALARAVAAEGGAAAPDPAELIEKAPFSTDRPYASTRSRRGDRIESLAIGAPEAVAGLASVEASGDSWWRGQLDAAAIRGERVVALAGRDGDEPWALRALIGFADALRPGIAEAVDAALGAGIQVVVVTGDHPATATAVARSAGLDGAHITLGTELAGWSDEELAERLPSLGIVARSTPDQKRRIVAAARNAGRLVAVTGDGVNDAPALQAADVGVAMGSGTAVAKGASDLVLGDDSFASLVFGLREGRRIVDNVQKGLVFLVSTHVALLGFIFVATVAGYSQPLLPIQILWLELFIDLSTSVAFEREPPEPDVMTRPPRHVSRPLLTGGLLARIGLAGGFSVAAALALFVLDPGGGGHGQWLAYTTLVCAQAVRAYANRSLVAPLSRLGWNRFLLFACLAVVGIQAAIPLVPPLADAFRAVPLSGLDWALVALVALAPAALAELLRRAGRGPWVA